jgi:hypothetical protein
MADKHDKLSPEEIEASSPKAMVGTPGSICAVSDYGSRLRPEGIVSGAEHRNLRIAWSGCASPSDAWILKHRGSAIWSTHFR